jgi:hypothetical protein
MNPTTFTLAFTALIAGGRSNDNPHGDPSTLQKMSGFGQSSSSDVRGPNHGNQPDNGSSPQQDSGPRPVR